MSIDLSSATDKTKKDERNTINGSNSESVGSNNPIVLPDFIKASGFHAGTIDFTLADLAGTDGVGLNQYGLYGVNDGTPVFLLSADTFENAGWGQVKTGEVRFGDDVRQTSSTTLAGNSYVWFDGTKLRMKGIDLELSTGNYVWVGNPPNDGDGITTGCGIGDSGITGFKYDSIPTFILTADAISDGYYNTRAGEFRAGDNVTINGVTVGHADYSDNLLRFLPESSDSAGDGLFQVRIDGKDLNFDPAEDTGVVFYQDTDISPADWVLSAGEEPRDIAEQVPTVAFAEIIGSIATAKFMGGTYTSLTDALTHSEVTDANEGQWIKTTDNKSYFITTSQPSLTSHFELIAQEATVAGVVYYNDTDISPANWVLTYGNSASNEDEIVPTMARAKEYIASTSIPLSQKGSASGVAELDSSGFVPTAQLPSFVDDVLEYANFAGLPGTGETGKIYVTLDDNKTFRWSGSAYVEISASLALGETSATAYRGDRGKTAYDHSQAAHAPSAAEENVQSDWNSSSGDSFIVNKPTTISTAQATAINDNTSARHNESHTIASHSDTSATGAELNILDGATLSTTELNYVDGVTSAIQTQLNLKAPSASPTFTGIVTSGRINVTSVGIYSDRTDNLTLVSDDATSWTSHDYKAGHVFSNASTEVTTANNVREAVSIEMLDSGQGTTGASQSEFINGVRISSVNTHTDGYKDVHGVYTVARADTSASYPARGSMAIGANSYQYGAGVATNEFWAINPASGDGSTAQANQLAAVIANIQPDYAAAGSRQYDCLNAINDGAYQGNTILRGTGSFQYGVDFTGAAISTGGIRMSRSTTGSIIEYDATDYTSFNTNVYGWTIGAASAFTVASDRINLQAGASTTKYIVFDSAVTRYIGASSATLYFYHGGSNRLSWDGSVWSTQNNQLRVPTTPSNANDAASKSYVDSAGSYTHPSYTARTESKDTGALSGATVISDLDFNISSDSSGHITSCDITTLNTRNMTASDIGAASSSHTHSSLTALSANLNVNSKTLYNVASVYGGTSYFYGTSTTYLGSGSSTTRLRASTLYLEGSVTQVDGVDLYILNLPGSGSGSRIWKDTSGYLRIG